jgi:hypothetical protein
LAASALGLVVFRVLGIGVEFVASAIDGAVYIHVDPPVREVLIRYRVWELYRAILSAGSAALCGWIVARVFPANRTLAVMSVAVTIAVSLLISLFTGPGYYLRDLVLIAAIALSPLVGFGSIAHGFRRTPAPRRDA